MFIVFTKKKYMGVNNVKKAKRMSIKTGFGLPPSENYLPPSQQLFSLPIIFTNSLRKEYRISLDGKQIVFDLCRLS